MPDHETGSGSFDAIFDENTSTATRIATLTVSASGIAPVSVTVTQAGITPTLMVTPANQNVSTAAGTTAFTVNSNSSWIATSDQTWCTVTPSGTGDGTITATYEQNTTMSPRIANIGVTVNGISPVNVTVTQEGLVGLYEIGMENLVLSPNPNEGRFSISTRDRSIANMTVIITDIHGKEISRVECSGKVRYTFDLTGQARGSYLVRITTGETTFIRKIIVE